MAISTANRNDYIGTGATATYPFTFKIFAETDLRATSRDTNDVETDLSYPGDFSVTGVGEDAGGSITLTAGVLTSGYVLTVRRVRPLSQETVLRSQRAFVAETHETSFDNAAMVDQHQQDELDRSVKLPETVLPSQCDPTLPVPVASKVIGYNSDGTELALYDPTPVTLTTLDMDNGVFLQAGSGAVQRSARSKLRERVSIDDFGAVGDGATSDRTALVNALAAADIVELTQGKTYYIPTGVAVASHKEIRAGGGFGAAVLKGANGQTILEPVTGAATVECVTIRGITFKGSGANAIKATSLSFYLSTWKVVDCHFSAELTDCIYGNLILCDIDHNDFGLFGTPGATHRHIYSKGTLAGNASNINRVKNNRFYHAAGAESVHFDSGYMLYFTDNNVEQNDATLSVVIKGMYGVVLRDNWFEQNAGTYQVSLTNDDLAVNGNYIVDVRDNWFDLSHAGNTHVFFLDGATTNVDLVNNAGVMSVLQYLTYYNTVDNDNIGIRTSFGNRMVGTYVPPVRHYGLGVMKADSVEFLAGNVVSFTVKNSANVNRIMIQLGATAGAALASFFDSAQLQKGAISAGANEVFNAQDGAGNVMAYLGVNGYLGAVTGVKVAGTKVVGAQGAVVADPTDAASVILRCIDILNRMRAHGLIAT